jgi:hypothetical protein
MSENLNHRGQLATVWDKETLSRIFVAHQSPVELHFAWFDPRYERGFSGAILLPSNTRPSEAASAPLRSHSHKKTKAFSTLVPF